jgi:hypothetical protein
MNIIERGRKAIKAFTAEIEQEEILANGQFSDKKDVDDPTGKFSGMRHVSTFYKTERLRRNVEFYKPEYDLPTIANAVQMDGLLQRATSIFVEQVLKNGYELTSKNDRLQQHVVRRIKEIQNLTGIPFYETMNYLAQQLVTYGNAYLIKVRSGVKCKEGKPFRLYGKNMNPIVGLFVADATTMEIGINDNGQVVNYKQVIRGEEIYWDERDVIHITYNKIPGTLTGMSSIIPILDDVRALRKLEEEIEILGFQYSIPLYLYKVGTKDQPPAPNEIEQVTSTVNNMPAYGMLVVPGHHTIEVPTNNNTPVDLISFIDHFKRRVYSGLGVSPIAMGEVDSSNRNTAESLDLSMQTITKRYQQIIKHSLEMELMREFMLDGGFNAIKEELQFNFPEIDLENQIKKETNIIQKFQNNLVTRTEARLELDYEKKIDESDTMLEVITIPEIQAKNGIALEVARIGASARVGASKKSASSSAKKTTSTAIRPTNQHGTLTGRPKIAKDYIFDVQDSISNKLFNVLSNDGYNSSLNITTLSNKISTDIKSKIKKQLSYTIRKYSEFYHIDECDIDISDANIYLDEVEKIMKDKVNRLSRKADTEIKIGIISDDIKKFLDLQKNKVDNLSKMLVYKSFGFKTILVEAKDCTKHITTNVNANDLSYSSIPPFRYNCNCIVDEESLYEFQK